MQPQTILLVGADQPHAARLRAALTTSLALRLVGDVYHSAEAAREAARLRPAAIVLAADLPGRLLVPLVRDLHTASDASKVVVISALAALDGAALRALLDLGVPGCLVREDTPPEALPPSLATVLAGGVVVSPRLLPALLGAHERRRGGRLEGLALTPHERALAREHVAEGAPRVALWVHDPAIAAGVAFHAGQVGLPLALVDAAGALLDAATHGAVLVVDCAAVPDALDRCLAIVPWTTRPVLICHPDEGFVDDLRAVAGGALLWLPPAWLGLRLRDRLRLLAATRDDRAAVGAGAAPIEPLTEREREVLGRVAAGDTIREIAVRLGLAPSTVKTHKANAMRKLGAGACPDVGRENEGTSPD